MIFGKITRASTLLSALGSAKSSALKNSPGAAHYDDVSISIYGSGVKKTLEVYCASKRGKSHIADAKPRQDSYSITANEEFLVVAIADGVSSSTLSDVGSKLVTENLLEVVTRRIHRGNILQPSAWFEVNQDLSKLLVSKYGAKARMEGETLPEKLSEIRERAADLYATTLEIVLFPLYQDNSSKFVSVRVCGDGGLYGIRRREVQDLYFDTQNQKPSKGHVGVLPVDDTMPIVKEHNLFDLESVLLCTDGISDFIQDKELRKVLRRLSKAHSISYADLTQLISIELPGGFDDQTLVLVKRP